MNTEHFRSRSAVALQITGTNRSGPRSFGPSRQTAGYDIIIANAQDDFETQSRRIRALLSWRPAAMVIVPCSDELPEEIALSRGDLPIVFVDRRVEATGFDTVCIDSLDAENSSNHLVELGHREVLIVASDLGLKTIRERCRGAQIRIEAARGRVETLEVGPVPESTTETMARWFERNSGPGAVFAVTDMTTLSMLTTLANRRFEAGKDVSALGFDDFPWMTARVVSRIWWKLPSGALRAFGFGSDQATRSRVIGSIG